MRDLLPHSSDDQPVGLRLGAQELLVIVGVWSFLALVAIAGRFLDPRIPGIAPQVAAAAIRLTLFEYFLWMLLTPPLLWFAARITEDDRIRIVKVFGALVAGLGPVPFIVAMPVIVQVLPLQLTKLGSTGGLLLSHTLPMPSLSASAWSVLATAGQLSLESATPSPSVSTGGGGASHASPTPSRSLSVCDALATAGQLSAVSAIPSPSASGGVVPWLSLPPLPQAETSRKLALASDSSNGLFFMNLSLDRVWYRR